MKLHRISIVQIFRVERVITVTVDAPDIQSAIDKQSESDAPAFSDPGWRDSWSLENEHVEQDHVRRASG